ncbi:MAG: TolC family outer membrane protein [Candidatus Symbiobacter sp.]|nr:TolC family outer membrane protein [Candidatus Symbiobacter sp.]
MSTINCDTNRLKPAHLRAIFLGVMLMGGLGNPPQAAAESLIDTLVSTYQNNPTLAAERNNFRVAAERLGQAQAQIFPTLSATASSSWQQQQAQTLTINSQPTNLTATVTQPIFKGAVFYGLSAAYDAVKAARQRLDLAEANQFLAAATAYFNLVQDKATLELRANNLRVLTTQLESVRSQFQIGQLTVTDVAQAEAAQQNAVAAKLLAESNLQIDRAVYLQVVGRLPDEKTSNDDTIPDQLLPHSLEEVSEQALRRNPAILAAQFDENVARSGVGVAASALLPSVNLVGSYGIQRQANLSAVGFPMQTSKVGQISIQVTVPIYDSGSSYSAVRQARLTANQSRLAADAALNLGLQNAMTSYQQLTSSRAQLISLDAAIRANRIALDGVKRQNEVGTSTVLDVLNAQQALLNSQVQKVQTEHNALIAAYQLLLHTGRFSAKELGLPVENYDADGYADQASWKFFGFGDPVPDATHP